MILNRTFLRTLGDDIVEVMVAEEIYPNQQEKVFFKDGEEKKRVSFTCCRDDI